MVVMPPAAVSSRVVAARRRRNQSRSLQHAFLVYIGAEKAGAVGFERAQDLFSRELGGLLPAFYYDAAVPGI
jgi:hypothetical protein